MRRTLGWTAMGLMGLVLAGCATVQPAPVTAFELAKTLACSQAQLDAADPTCLVLSDPRASDSDHRASRIADILAEAGYAPVKLWATPAQAGDRVLGFGAVQNRGACFDRRDCGDGFPHYVAVALPGPDGELQVIDPSVLDAPADVTAWLSTLVLGGKSLVDVQVGTVSARASLSQITADGTPVFSDVDPGMTEAGLKAAYCDLPSRRSEFRGPLALRGYDRPKRADASCEGV